MVLSDLLHLALSILASTIKNGLRPRFEFSTTLRRIFSIFFFFLRARIPCSACSDTEPSWKDCPTDEVKKLIDCSNFGLTKIPLDIYDSSWHEIRFSRNPFTCDCTMNTFLHDERFPEYLRRTKDLKNAECAQPTSYAGVGILKLADDPTFCKDGGEEIEQENDFWSFFKVNTRFIASVVLVFFLLILMFATCFKRCTRDDYLSHHELLPSHSAWKTKQNPFFLSKLFGRTTNNDTIALNQSTELTEDDDVIYENIR